MELWPNTENARRTPTQEAGQGGTRHPIHFFDMLALLLHNFIIFIPLLFHPPCDRTESCGAVDPAGESEERSPGRNPLLPVSRTAGPQGCSPGTPRLTRPWLPHTLNLGVLPWSPLLPALVSSGTHPGLLWYPLWSPLVPPWSPLVPALVSSGTPPGLLW